MERVNGKYANTVVQNAGHGANSLSAWKMLTLK
jgi:hypothetical protein